MHHAILCLHSVSVSGHPYLNISLGTCFVCTRNKLLKSSKNKSPSLTPTIFVWAPFPPPSFFFFPSFSIPSTMKSRKVV
ncbi:unnamed protein product [Prunus brigantina]